MLKCSIDVAPRTNSSAKGSAGQHAETRGVGIIDALTRHLRVESGQLRHPDQAVTEQAGTDGQPHRQVREGTVGVGCGHDPSLLG
ncbi:MAG TPA: hypothetical protein VFW69_24975 [Mycobacterium sp.]|nr:hypothetical protein [Mycobacterium sp.]